MLLMGHLPCLRWPRGGVAAFYLLPGALNCHAAAWTAGPQRGHLLGLASALRRDRRTCPATYGQT